MRFPIDWSSETARRAAFTYMTRTGCAPHFGSRPVGWYQAHVCHALDVFKEALGADSPAPVRLRDGIFYCRTGEVGRRAWWRALTHRSVGVLTPERVYAEADKRSRR